jgi:hypothetical protein
MRNVSFPLLIGGKTPLTRKSKKRPRYLCMWLRQKERRESDQQSNAHFNEGYFDNSLTYVAGDGGIPVTE